MQVVQLWRTNVKSPDQIKFGEDIFYIKIRNTQNLSVKQ